MGKIEFDIWFHCYRYGSNFRKNEIPLGYCEETECVFFKGRFSEEDRQGIICSLLDIERDCKNCLYQHNQKDDNTCGYCGFNRGSWTPSKELIKSKFGVTITPFGILNASKIILPKIIEDGLKLEQKKMDKKNS